MIHCFAAMAEKQALEPYQYEAKDLQPHDVKIQISHCGICHSDLHLIDNDWRNSTYPLVPGHEIIGEVVAMGTAVDSLEIGQRVGVGWQRGACLSCEWCIKGEENLCARRQLTCVGHHGGFAEQVVIHERFAFAIPDALSSEDAAPLLCAGITVYSPLRHYAVTANMRVGVIGIGGLGHLALQFARAFGCEVTAFTSTQSKAEEARRFGAHHVISSTDQQAMAKAASSHDFILSTVHVNLDWPTYLRMLRPQGKLCFVGAVDTPIQLPVMALIGGSKSICGSGIGNCSMMQEMLFFAARHGISAQTEVMPMSKVNDAITRVRENKARYRIVLHNGSS